MLALNMANIFGQSPTVDEFAHVPAGYSYWVKQDFSLYPQNPPLIKMLLALPLKFMDLQFPLKAYQNAAGPWAPWFFGDALARANPVKVLRVYAAARVMNMLLGALLGLVVFGWTARHFGMFAGTAAMALTVTSPTVLAHAGIATVDVGTTLFFLLALLAFHRSLEWPSLINTALAGTALGLALLSKFTCLLLLPVWGAQVLISTGLDWREQRRGSGIGRDSGIPRQRLVTGLVVPIVALAVLNGGYLFKHVGVTPNQTHGASRFMKVLINNGLGDIPLPLPRDYMTGLDLQLTDVAQGEFPNYVNGRWQKEGVWYYFGEALLLKETIPGILIMLIALLTGVWRGLKNISGPALGRVTPLWLFLYFPALIFFTAVSLSGNLQLGVRYMLPVIPLLFMAAAIVLLGNKNTFTPRTKSAKRAMFLRIGLVGTLCLWQAVVVVRAHPLYLSYFNCVAGFTSSAEGGAAYLLDSNLDWGQDLPALADELEKLGRPEVGLLYFGHAHPRWYGIKAHLPGPDDRYVAISVNFLYGYPYALPYLGRWSRRPPMISDAPLQGVRQLAAYYKTRQPLFRAGGSIYLYDNTWPVCATSLGGQNDK